MSALSLRLPDDKHERLRALAQSRGTSVNRLPDEVTALLLAGVPLAGAAESSPLLAAYESSVPLAGAVDK